MKFLRTGTDVQLIRQTSYLSAAKCAALVGVSPRTWFAWEATGSAPSPIPFSAWHLFMLVTNQHPKFHLEPGYPPRERQCKVTDVR